MRSLEFPQLLNVVADYASSAPGAEAVRRLVPVTSREQAQQQYEPVEELLDVMLRDQNVPLGDLVDAEGLWNRLERENALLAPEEWLIVLRILQTTGRVAAFFGERREQAPTIAAIAARLTTVPELVQSIRRIIDEDGAVRDSASEELASIRRSMRKVRERMQKQFDTTLRELGPGGALQNDYWTLRNGRHVLPVKATHRGRISGIVHDSSNSGETLFVEPYIIIELSNETVALQSREAEEVRRILIALGDEARPHVDALRQNNVTLVEIDSLYARARYGYRNRLHVPAFAWGDGFSIREARHPLIIAAGNRRPIPIELDFKPGQRVLVLTGPNTGGKTTTLKTLGILCLMAQCAIPVPAHPDSQFPVFSAVFADIGDEQNLAEGISTFSAHLRSLDRVLREAKQDSLVLLDELGTATDPIQGGALGATVLERLAEKGASVLVTTHLPTLKHWAHEYGAARNAATRFDEIEGRPTFQILYDQPGSSEAFRVARQLGFPPDVIDDAERRVPEGERTLQSILANLEEKEKQLTAELERSAQLRKELEQERATVKEQRMRLQDAERKHRQTVLQERQALLTEARSRLETRLKNTRDAEEMRQVRAELRAEQATVEKETRDLQAKSPEFLPFAQLQPGMTVYVRTLKDSGRVVRVNPKKKSVVVEARGTQIELPAHQLARPPKEEEPVILPPRREMPKVIRAEKTKATAELNLHGERVEAAIEKVDQFLNRAVMDNIDTLWIQVGYGVLRRSVEEVLRKHSLVREYHRGTDEEGGEAVIVVRIG